MRRLKLTVQLNTKLNRSHLLVGENAFILPVLGRTERDIQAGGPQAVTVEDSMSMVHASSGKLKPASEHLRSEVAIIAGIARAALPNSKVAWMDLVEDYDRIRDKNRGRVSLIFRVTTSGFAFREVFDFLSRRPRGCGPPNRERQISCWPKECRRISRSKIRTF